MPWGPTLALSVVCADLARLETCLSDLPDLGIQRLHVDLIDPSFGNLGLAPEMITDLKGLFAYAIDAHVMVDKPAPFIEGLVLRGADAITVQQSNITPDVARELARAQTEGVRIGVAVSPSEVLHPGFLDILRPEQVTVMTVEPGGTGRPFRREALDTVRNLAHLRRAGQFEVLEVDGAIGPATAPDAVRNGATQLVLGTSVFPERSLSGHRVNELRSALSFVSVPRPAAPKENVHV